MATSHKDTDWEFDAPKYYDFTKPDGSNDRVDSWFRTGYRSTSTTYMTPSRQLTEPASRIARPEKNNQAELSAIPGSSNGKHTQLPPEPQKKRIDIFSALAKTSTMQTAPSGQKNITTRPSQPSPVQHKDHVLQRPIGNSNALLKEAKTSQSLRQHLPVRPQAVEKRHTPSRDIMAARSSHEHHDSHASHRPREEPPPLPSPKRPRRDIFEDLNKFKVTKKSEQYRSMIAQHPLETNRSETVNGSRQHNEKGPPHLSETAKVNALSPVKPAPERFQKNDKNKTSNDLLDDDNVIVDDVQSVEMDLGDMGDDTNGDIDEEFSKSVERLAEERIDKSFIHRLNRSDGVIPNSRESIFRIQSNSGSPDLVTGASFPEGTREEATEMREDANDDLTRPTDFNAIFKKVDSIRAQLTAAASSEQQTKLSSDPQHRMQVDDAFKNPHGTKMDFRTISSIDERIARARRIIDESLKQSKTWFERKPISSKK